MKFYIHFIITIYKLNYRIVIAVLSILREINKFLYYIDALEYYLDSISLR